MSRTYQLSLHREYVRHWGFKEAIRELIQNQLDFARKDKTDLDYDFNSDTLTMRSPGASLDPAQLLLGNTSKANEHMSIGSFGEGFKLALLVLTRLGHDVTILTGSKMWVPKFEHSEQFESEVLCIEERDYDRPDYETLTFVVAGLELGHEVDIREMCLQMQPPQTDVIETERGQILPCKKGKLYIGGLYVCDTKMWFGYNFNPNELKVERDRQTVSGFELAQLTKDTWYSSEGQEELIASLIDRKCPDFEYGHWATPKKVVEAVSTHHRKTYGSRPVATSQHEADEIETRMIFNGNSRSQSGVSSYADLPTRPVIVPDNMASILKQSPSYKEEVQAAAVTKTPYELLSDFQMIHHTGIRRMNKETRAALRQLTLLSKTWKS